MAKVERRSALQQIKLDDGQSIGSVDSDHPSEERDKESNYSEMGPDVRQELDGMHTPYRLNRKQLTQAQKQLNVRQWLRATSRVPPRKSSGRNRSNNDDLNQPSTSTGKRHRFCPKVLDSSSDSE